MRILILVLGCLTGIAAALSTTPQTVRAHVFPCDFLTGGGFIITTASGTHEPAKANFGVGGGCKHGSPTWGHLEYHDHGTGLNVHWTSITAYLLEGDGDTGVDPKTKQPTGTRLICGTARTNHFGDVDFMVRARDDGEPGVERRVRPAAFAGRHGSSTPPKTSPGLPQARRGGTAAAATSSCTNPIRRRRATSAARAPRAQRPSSRGFTVAHLKDNQRHALFASATLVLLRWSSRRGVRRAVGAARQLISVDSCPC